ncbi:MAG: cytochrome c oxidase subunit 3 family protein [Calditrichia bacterium]
MSTHSEALVERHYDPIGSRVGMWLFLFTEILLFGGLFLLYAVYMNKYPQDFHYASGELDQFVGALNTIILLTSSLTMVLAVASLQRKKTNLTVIFLITTIFFGLVFLINKYFEWSAKFEHGLYPGAAELLQHSHGEIMFYSLYFAMTGLHALHVMIGMVIMGFLTYFVLKKGHTVASLPPHILDKFIGKRLFLTDETGRKLWESEKINKEVTGVEVVLRAPGQKEPHESNIVKLENGGLYWHLVDIIWIFLFPLFYLIAI